MAKGASIGMVLGWIGTALAAAALAGGGVYFWQGGQVSQLREDLNVTQRQLTELQSGDDTLGRDEPVREPGQDETSDDARRLLTYSMEEGYGAENITSCLPQEFDANAFNMADPSTTVAYKSQDYGFALEIPWNPDWGTSACRVNPFDETTTSAGDGLLLFGPLIAGEGGLGRLYSLQSIEGRDTDDAIAAIVEENSEGVLTEGPLMDTLAGLDVVTYASAGLCDIAVVEVIGSGDFNYVLTNGCSVASFEDTLAEYEAVLEGLEIQ